MTRSLFKCFMAGLICAGICIAALPAQAKEDEDAKKATEKSEQITITGMAKAAANKTDATKKHLEVTTKDEGTFMLLGKVVSSEIVAQMDGKTVKVTGTKKAKSERKILYVSTIEEVK
jgi:hypothetical protein